MTLGARTRRAATPYAGLAFVALLISCMSAVPGAPADDIPQVAFLGFQLINTSLEPTTPAEDQRIHMLDDLLRQKLDASGRFKIVSIPPDLRQEITDGPEISNCNGCQRDWLERPGRIGPLGVPSRR